MCVDLDTQDALKYNSLRSERAGSQGLQWEKRPILRAISGIGADSQIHHGRQDRDLDTCLARAFRNVRIILLTAPFSCHITLTHSLSLFVFSRLI